jgi:hypothetical protein
MGVKKFSLSDFALIISPQKNLKTQQNAKTIAPRHSVRRRRQPISAPFAPHLSLSITKLIKIPPH